MARVAEMTAVPIVDVPTIQVSPLPIENHYHPFFGQDDETDANRLATMTTPLVVRLVPLLMRKVPTLGFRLVLEQIGH